MCDLQSNLKPEKSYLDKSLKYDYHGNKYSLFISVLDPGKIEVEIAKQIENIGVTDIIDVKMQNNKFLESYAEVNLFSIESVQRIKKEYICSENIFPFT